MSFIRTPVSRSFAALAAWSLGALAASLPASAHATTKADGSSAAKVTIPRGVATPVNAPRVPKVRKPSSPAPSASNACVPPQASEPAPFGIGETLDFEIDSLGARVGTFSMHLTPGRGDAKWQISARAKTDTFASNFYEVSAKARAELGAGLMSRAYEEDAIEKGIHRTLDITLPVPSNGTLTVRATREGTPRHFQVNAPRETRDLLSALHAARAMPFSVGDEICLPIFGGHRMWTLRMKVVGREPVTTPAGTFDTLHLEGMASRMDTNHSREVHLWFSDDDARVPVAAFGLIQGKPVRAQLVKWEQGRRVADARRR